MLRLIRTFLLLTSSLGRLAAVEIPEKLRYQPLPETARLQDAEGHDNGVRFVDLNGDGHEDIVVSNPHEYGVFLFVPKERAKANLQWDEGWSQVMREGKAVDANSLPLIVDANGRDLGVTFRDGAMWIEATKQRIPFSELLKVPGPAPRSPQDSLKAMKLKPGFEAMLVAHEPLVQDPVFINWDAKGRMWVVEMGDYPFAPGEKTKDGSMGQDKVSDLQAGRVKILTDTDGDGVYDKASLFLDGLKHPTGLAPWKNGVIIANIPDIFFAEDTDGDGKCDKRETWFSGFTAGNPQHLVNGFCWGLDGWFYGANGDSGGDITCVKTGKINALGTNDFRFDPRTGEFALEGGRSQYGKWRDDFGNWFGNNNATIGWHYWLPFRHLERHPEIVAKSVRGDLNGEKRVFPASPPVRRFNQGSAVNTLTSGCSPMPFRDTTFGADGENVMFICEPANNLVHREVLSYDGAHITSKRHPGDAESEFIASEDNWFRPSMARTGPDGALYVVDMYRLVLEHPEWIPAEIAKGLDLRGGEDKGRIYRIGRTGPPQGGTTVPDPIKAMASANGWMRDTAQRLLIERGDAAAVTELKNLLTAAPAVKIQAAFTIMQLGGMTSDELHAAIQPLAPQVRAAALTATGTSSDDVFIEVEKPLLKQSPQKAPAVAVLPVITNNNPNRQKVVAKYITEVVKLGGDAKRGAAVFQKLCMVCHKVRDLGIEVGPDLLTVVTKPREQLIEAIFDPNRAVEQRNAATQVTKKDKTMIVGQLASETPGNITIRMPGGAEMVVLRSDIQDMKTLTTSIMPEGLESVLTMQDVADVLTFIGSK
ncbi:PVC-type heme-binding CxxCH protein [Prosthecobacter sp.]|uniref:PVC-type heme-binding CxxCH protein n=1 Tax=Prosthecobacter sp. TaxID=1965333 RepID=UPI002AB9A25D|nr:PVC-type heme-binding CxxCH protein [Prosthecobacter sp.]MDZ4404631.1 PVC-type heme-binding CxxCH protein [Prosthecobacter sp.]